MKLDVGIGGPTKNSWDSVASVAPGSEYNLGVQSVLSARRNLRVRVSEVAT